MKNWADGSEGKSTDAFAKDRGSVSITNSLMACNSNFRGFNILSVHTYTQVMGINKIQKSKIGTF